MSRCPDGAGIHCLGRTDNPDHDSIADEALVIPLVYKNETAVWNGDVIADYDYYYDANYTLVQNIRLK